MVINELALGVVEELEEGEDAQTEVSPEQIERLTDVVKVLLVSMGLEEISSLYWTSLRGRLKRLKTSFGIAILTF